MASKPFQIIDFNPMGFLQKNYPTPYCSICRGYLADVCENCTINHSIDCNVSEKDGSYCHNHCYDMMEKEKDEPKRKKVVTPVSPGSESESE